MSIQAPVVVRLAVLAVLVRLDLAYSQELHPNAAIGEQVPPVPSGFIEQTSKNASAACLEPPPLPGLKDYEGPMQKTVGIFARALERKSVHEPHYKTGLPLCSLRFDDKFMLFVEDALDPVTFLSAGIDATIDHASDRDHSYGQGAAGLTRRFGADVTDRVSAKFFKDFAYPVIFSEDPRYYRLGSGSTGRRLWHAVEHRFVAYSPKGTRMINYSEWLGTATSVAIGNLYHPGNDRGASGMAREMGYQFAWDTGFDVLREFWPEIARSLKLPFRGTPKAAPKPATTSPAGSCDNSRPECGPGQQ